MVSIKLSQFYLNSKKAILQSPWRELQFGQDFETERQILGRFQGSLFPSSYQLSL